MSVYPQKKTESKKDDILRESRFLQKNPSSKNSPKKNHQIKNKSEYINVNSKNEVKNKNQSMYLIHNKTKSKKEEEIEQELTNHFSKIDLNEENKIYAERRSYNNNLDNSFNMYKMFYDNLNKKKSESGIIEIDNNSKKIHKNDFQEYKVSNELNESIKDIIGHDIAFDLENEKNIEESNLKKNSKFAKKKQEEFFESNNDLQKVPTKENDESDLHNFLKLHEYPLFKKFDHLITLKATSLFENSVLFENELILIKCKSTIFIHRAEKIVSLFLLYIPKKKSMKITTHLLSYDNINSNPPYIMNQYLDSELSQEFTLKLFGETKTVNFQKLQLSIFHNGTNAELFLPLPFTINKFVKIANIDSEKLDHFLSFCSNLGTFQIKLNSDIVNHPLQLLEIFQNAIQLTESMFLLFLDFGVNLEAVLEINIFSHEIIEIKLHAKNQNKLFEEFIKWFMWIFN